MSKLGGAIDGERRSFRAEGANGIRWPAWGSSTGDTTGRRGTEPPTGCGRAALQRGLRRSLPACVAQRSTGARLSHL
jgi:hypothetical protein